jgi:ribonuclease R
VDFDLPEVSMVFDPKGHVARVEPRHRNDAHRIIEECMIAANVEAARFLEKAKIPTLYRVHAPPQEDRIATLKEFLGAFGLSLPTPERLEPKHLSALVRDVAGRPDADLIETVILRSMSAAVYQPENIGHFGLALERYAHFTSPIRRYPDLLVHRAIRHLVRGGPPESFVHGKQEMEGLGRHTSMTERRADEATREAMDWLKCEFMLERVGEEFDVLVTGVVDFGLFVQIKEFQIDGLVHISSLGGDYYQRDPVHQRLIGQRTGRVFRLSDPLRVRLLRVSLEDRKIDFELVEAIDTGAREPHGARRGKGEPGASAKGGKGAKGAKGAKGGDGAKSGGGKNRGGRRRAKK